MTAHQRIDGESRVIAERNGLRLAIGRTGERGVGQVLVRPDDPGLIQGVEILPLKLFPDDRGYFLELARLGQGLASHLGPQAHTQVSGTLSYPGTIKALHYHTRQTDVWAPVAGMFQVCLYDLRTGSGSFARINTVFIGSLRPWSLRIPPGVAHGYKVVSHEPGVLVYVTDRFYDPEDEGRIAYNDPDINYDWELQHK
jgi:dTDP-4-dehydrorhamnose 3,5-epimerase